MGVIIAVTGASGSIYGITLLKELQRLNIRTHLVLTKWGEENIRLETEYTPEQVRRLASFHYKEQEMTAPVASGSFPHRGMVVAPCSMKTLAAIASGNAHNLVARAADVCIKEQRRLVLLPRETPLNPIHLENMLKLARTGASIMPPVPSFYDHPETIEDIVRQTTGRVLDLLGIENNLVKRWGS